MASKHLLRTTLPTVLCLLFCCSTALAQNDDRPAPEAPTSEPDPPAPQSTPTVQDDSSSDTAAEANEPLEPQEEAHRDRRPMPEGKVTFAFDNVGVDEIIPWIAKMTGKIVMPLGLDGAGIGKIE